MNSRTPLALAFAFALASLAPLPAAADDGVADSPLRTAPTARSGKALSDADVGDADSFGRPLRWLGVADAQVELRGDCSEAGPDAACQELAPAPAATSFSFEDLGRIVLPARASSSLLCHWFSPVLDVTYANPTPAPVVARLQYQPTLTIENPVLATPGLVDPTTGLPFAGRLRTGMTASERLEVALPAGLSLSERNRDSAVCIAGFLTLESLVQLYGLSEAQAREFFRQPTTVRLNISGQALHVHGASLYFGLRIVGD